TQESRVYGVDQNDDGYNFGIAPGVGWFFRDNMQMNLKYVVDVAGENELQGQGFNLRFLWIF
ncbi:MAG: transporter, partial [Deltaproteobacteria bacterium]|nr:transporter [Deltaproteobacteria bacterium]